MKLPTDKAERTKILMIIGIAVIGVGYVAYSFGLSPLLAKQRATSARITELEDLLWRGKNDINMIPINLKQNCETLEQILDISEVKRQILRPSLGNYLLVASDIVESRADALNLKIDKINETIARKNMPRTGVTTNPNAPRFMPYAVNVSLACGLADLVQLVRALEEDNPYLCITRLGVIENTQTPESHAVSFDIQWPIWNAPTHSIQLAAEHLSDKEKL